MRFVFFGGKGGVGKTTCAAAAAVRAAHDGERVLVVSTDPAHSLGDALGLKLGAAPKRVAERLWAAELDADRALTRWLRTKEEAIRTVAERGTYFDEEDVDRFLSLSFPGVDELVGLIELRRLASLREHDVVVVDTAPTGHTLRLLEMPDTLKRLGEVLDGMHEKHRFLAASLGGRWRGDFVDEAIAEIEKEASELRARLTDASQTTFTWVTLPEEMSVLEAEDGVRGVESLGVRVDVIVVNRVWPPPDRKCALCSPRVADESEWKSRIAEVFAGKTILETPARATEPRSPPELLALAESVHALEIGKAQRAVRVAFADSATTLLPIGDGVKLVLVGGKGGVGKTTVAASLALELAKSRRRTLLLSTDPAHSLGDVLDVKIGDRETKIEPGLHVRELDAAKAWAKERDRYRRSVSELFDSIFRGSMDASFDRAVLEDLLDLAPPGLDELLAIVTILDALAGDGSGHDLVVVDTAPTGHTLRLLALPGRALEWVHALMSVVLKYRSVIGLGEFAQDLTTLAKRLRALIALLEDASQCAFVVVTRAAALPRLETERLVRELRKLKVPLAAIVVNAVTRAGCSRCTAIADAEQREIAKLAGPLLVAPAIYPPPRGVRELRRFRGMLRAS